MVSRAEWRLGSFWEGEINRQRYISCAWSHTHADLRRSMNWKDDRVRRGWIGPFTEICADRWFKIHGLRVATVNTMYR